MARLFRFIRRLLRMLWPHRHRQGAVWLNLEPCMATVLKPNGVVTASIHPVNAAGEPAPVTDIVWAVDNPVVSLTVAADNMSCQVQAIGLGPAKLTVSAKSVGGVALSASADYDVQADLEAVDLGLVPA